MRFHCLQHVPFESPGNIEVWAKQKEHTFSFTHLYHNKQLPALNDFDVLIIMGGPMSIYDENIYPWLKKEKEFIRAAIRQGKKMHGICLGSQLIADALDTPVYNNREKEIDLCLLN